MNVEIDKKSGFCFGVVNAIDSAVEELERSGVLYCFGDIVHNSNEVYRLEMMGLKTIDHEQFLKIKGKKVLIRAHGEPPETYRVAEKNGVTLIDATCPIVLRLQKRVKKGYEEMQKKNGQIVILGKDGHAEVKGLKGHAQGNAIVVNSVEDIEKIDFSRPARLYAQTTQNPDTFKEISSAIEKKMSEAVDGKSEYDFIAYDTICRRVCNRASELKKFALKHDVVVFAGDPKSSNGQYLYGVCKKSNPKTYFVSSIDDINSAWFKNVDSVGICGATSTPSWVMESIKDNIKKLKP